MAFIDHPKTEKRGYTYSLRWGLGQTEKERQTEIDRQTDRDIDSETDRECERASSS